MVRQYEYQPCIPTRGTEVPAGPDWFHEIKHDGYRLIVQREGKRVRLLTRRGYDWSDRYPLIAEAALRLRKQSFVIDGEAVVLGPDGISDFAGLHSGTCNEEVRLYAFDLLSDDAVAVLRFGVPTSWPPAPTGKVFCASPSSLAQWLCTRPQPIPKKSISTSSIRRPVTGSNT
jgi:bifunctional non-homologous end joining protein LigD